MGDDFNEGFDDFDSNMTDPGEVFDDFPAEIPDDLPAEIPDDYPDEIPDDFADEIPAEVPDEIPAEIPDEIPAEIPDEIPAEIPDEIPAEIPDEIPAEIPDEIPAEIPDDTLHQGYIDSPVTGDGNVDPVAISGYEQAEEVSEEIDSAGQELNDIPFEVSEPEDRPALDAMSQYMADHNYSPEDAAEYQKDPEWQALNRDLQEEDGIERDPHQDMQEYMINHNYGLGDTPEFHADPEWQEINNRVLESEGAQPVNYEEMIPPEEDMTVSDEIPDDYEMPEDVTDINVGGDGIPEDFEDTDIPEETEMIPEDTEVVPEVTEEVPQVPEAAEEIPEAPESVPETAEEIPEAPEAVPETAEEIPEAPEAVPEAAEEIPEAPEAVTEVTEDMPEAPELVPEMPEEMPEDTEMVPETPEDMPEDAEVVPEAAEEIPEAPEVVPEDTEPVTEETEAFPEDTEPVTEDTEIIHEDTEPVTAEVTEEAEPGSSVENMEETSDHPALDAMAQYMSDHNYGLEDAEEYRNDPEWQKLNRDLLIESGMDPADFGGEPVQEIPGTVERVNGVAQELEMGDYEEMVTLEDPDFYKEGEFLQQGLNEYGFNGTCGETTQANTLNKLFETNRFTENNVLDVAVSNNLCEVSMDPDACGGTNTRQFLQLYEKMDEQLGGNKLDVQCFDFENALSPEEVAAQIEGGKMVNVAVDAGCLWDEPQDYVDELGNPVDNIYSDHWIAVTGVNRDAAGNIASFDIVDSGGGETNVSLQKYEEMCFGSDHHGVLDPTTIVVSRKDTQSA